MSKPDLPKKRKKRSKKVRVIDQKKYANNLQFEIFMPFFRELDWDEAENVNVVLQHMFDPKESWVCLANY